MSQFRPERDPERPVYVISVAATPVSTHPRTLRIYDDEGLLCPARTPTNIRLYSENDIRRLTWIRHLTRDRGVNLAGIKLLFGLEERLGARILEALYAEATDDKPSGDQRAPHESSDRAKDDRAPSIKTKTTTPTSTPTATATATANPNLGDT